MMTNTKHTPGPWVYENNECPWVFDADTHTVAKIYSTKPDGAFLRNETKANAHLIAAAPEQMRNVLYLIAKLMGDASAIQKNRIAQRIWRRLVGRVLSRLIPR